MVSINSFSNQEAKNKKFKKEKHKILVYPNINSKSTNILRIIVFNQQITKTKLLDRLKGNIFNSVPQYQLTNLPLPALTCSPINGRSRPSISCPFDTATPRSSPSSTQTRSSYVRNGLLPPRQAGTVKRPNIVEICKYKATRVLRKRNESFPRLGSGGMVYFFVTYIGPYSHVLLSSGLGCFLFYCRTKERVVNSVDAVCGRKRMDIGTGDDREVPSLQKITRGIKDPGLAKKIRFLLIITSF